MRKETEYSDETAKSVSWTIDQLVDRFITSAEHDALAKAHRPHVRAILRITADGAYGYNLETVELWSKKGLAEVFDHVLPHKVIASKPFFRAVQPVLLAFFQWGQGEGVWGKRDVAQVIAYIPKGCKAMQEEIDYQRQAAAADQEEPEGDDYTPWGSEPDREVSEPVRVKRSRISKPNGKVYQLRISLKEITPEIWRQVEVADITLAKLHGVIQYGMGWKNCHLHMFHTPQGRFTDPKFNLAEEEWCADVGDSRRIRLGDLLAAPGDAFGYEYDFGDSWHHVIVCAAIREPAPGERYPVKSRCLAGARACPPEDVGSASGYEELLRVLSDPSDEEHEHMVGWSMQPRDRPYDPEYFDLELANRLIAP
jgi:hypothetical protein